MKRKLKTLGRAVFATQDSPNMVKKGGIWVHQGIPEEALDSVKAVRDEREDRLNQLLAAME
jgi:hypothetical protein